MQVRSGRQRLERYAHFLRWNRARIRVAHVWICADSVEKNQEDREGRGDDNRKVR